MSKKVFSVFVSAILLTLSTLAFAQEEETTEVAPPTEAGGTVALVDRGIVVPEGKGEVGFDLWINLSKDFAGKAIYLSGNGPFDRYPGLSFGYGLMDKLELGFAAPIYLYTKGGEANAGFNIYAKYAFIEFLAAELQIQLPSFKKFGDNRVAVLLGFPFKYVVQKGFLAVHARPDLKIWLWKKDTLGAGKEAMQLSLFFDLGATFNFTPELFADLSFGIGKILKPSGTDPTIPLGLFFGYTLMPELDLGLFFGFNDLKGAKADARYVGIQAAYRF